MVYPLLNATAMMGFERWTQLCLKGKLRHPDYKLAMYGCQGPECRGDNILSERQMDKNR